MNDFDFSPEEWLRMQEECNDTAVNRSNAVEAAIKNNSCYHFASVGDYLVGRWVMVAEIIDELGERHLAVFGSPNLEPWEAIGMTASMGLS